mgnify:CR=1 FL=1
MNKNWYDKRTNEITELHIGISGRGVFAGKCLAVPQPAQEQTEKQPNIILIVADDLGYGDLSCYGAHRIQTPGMDRIANEGIRFTQGFCTAATSTPQPLFGDDREISLEQCGC